MNGLFNMMTFVMTLALTENAIPQADTSDKFKLALAGGQSKNLLGPVLLKVGAIDPIASLTQESTTLKAELAACQAKLADFGPFVTKGAEIKKILDQVKAKANVEDLRSDSDLLGQIIDLANGRTT